MVNVLDRKDFPTSPNTTGGLNKPFAGSTGVEQAKWAVSFFRKGIYLPSSKNDVAGQLHHYLYANVRHNYASEDTGTLYGLGPG